MTPMRGTSVAIASMRRPSGWATPTRLAAAVLCVAVALVACTNTKDADTGKTADAQEAGRMYAQCMRDNGVPDFPDPGPDGRFSGQAHEQQDDPKFRAAIEKCRDLAPGGEHENTGDPAFVDQMRDYAQCMRDNGVPDFPDPDADGRFRGRGHEQQSDPTFRAAMETCRPKLPGGGEHR
jgi:hypothetical protein